MVLKRPAIRVHVIWVGLVSKTAGHEESESKLWVLVMALAMGISSRTMATVRSSLLKDMETPSLYPDEAEE